MRRIRDASPLRGPPRLSWRTALSRINSRATSVGLLGIALAGLTLSSAAFATQPIAQGATVNKTAEGKCGEGKCGANGAKAAKARKVVAAIKTAEGKCGEGQCGDSRFGKTDADHDGRVSRAEYVAVVPDGVAGFAKKDTNRDGFISEKEAYDFVKATYEAHGKKIPLGVFSAIQSR